MTAVPWRNGAGSGLTLTPGYDDLGRIVAVNDGTNDRVADTYKGHLLEKRTYANGVYLTHLDNNGQNLSGYGYDAFGRLKNQRWKDDGGSLLAGWSHDYDRIGNKEYQEDLQSATQSELYGYDTVYRLDDFKRGQLNEAKTDITNPTRTQTWALDPLGNWDETDVDSVTETRTHNTVNELTARTVGQGPQISLVYDDAGNLTQDGDANGDHKYTWDYRNRLVKAEEKQSGEWATVGEYRYDAQGRRVRKAVSNKGTLNGVTRFVWRGQSHWQCLEERDADDDLAARFTYSPGYIDAVAVQERDLNSDADFADDGEVTYYSSNTLFSVYGLTNPDGSVRERYRYDAYGAATVLDPDGSADGDGLSDVRNPYVFTGRRLDPETGLVQYRFRYYSPALGRFLGPDPHRFGAWSLFVFVAGRPCILVDPFGLTAQIPEDVSWLFVGRFPPDATVQIIERNPRMPSEEKCRITAQIEASQFEVWVEVKTRKTVRRGRTWAWADVRMVIGGDPRAKGVLQAMETCELMEYDTAGTERQYYKDEAMTIEDGGPIWLDNMGFFWANQHLIAVEQGFMSDAVATFFHEGTHARHYFDWFYFGSGFIYSELGDEYVTWIAEEWFRIRHGMPPAMRGFRKCDASGRCVPDLEAIWEYVNRTYAPTRPHKDKNYPPILRPIRGWTTHAG